MVRRPYDTQKNRVYAAESKCSPGREFETMTDLERWGLTVYYVDRLFNPVDPVFFKEAHGNAKFSHADLITNTISIYKYHMDEQVVLHELAHLTVDPDHCAFHGPEFCWNYLDLTLRWRGVDAYIELRNAFKEEGCL